MMDGPMSSEVVIGDADDDLASGSAQAKVLIVDDDKVFRERLSLAFSRHGYVSYAAGSVTEAREMLDRYAPSHVVVDLRLAAESGLEVVEQAASRTGCRVVMLTGYGSIATALEAVRLGAVDYVAKPAGFLEIEAALFGKKPSEGAPELAQASVETPSLDKVAWEHMQRVLHDSDGNVTQAAKRLGIHRQALQRRLKKTAPRR